VAERYQVSRPTVSLWRKRYAEHGLAGLHNQLKPGRPRSMSEDEIAGLIQMALPRKPKALTHWSRRSLAEETGLSKSTVHRYLTLFGRQPHRSKSIKLSNDPFFIEKVRDIVGLYLNPPDHALVLCVDEKTQCQALERTQPISPMGLGYVEGITHDYIRHGTTTLFAALDAANGTVLAQCKPEHGHQEFVAESGRALVRVDYQPGDPSRLLRFRCRPQAQDRYLRKTPQPAPHPVPVDRDR